MGNSDEQVPGEPYFARRAHPLWLSLLLYCVSSKSQRHTDLKLVKILIRVMHLLFTDMLKNMSCSLCLPFTLWINSILNTISPLFGKVLYISVCGPGVSIGLTLPWLELSVTCLFSLLKVPPPKPPRRQGGWADDPVLAPTKWVLTSFLIKRDLGVE